MDESCVDFEFFDFNNVSEDEVKEIQAILRSPRCNGCVELPWEIPVKENNLNVAALNEGHLNAKEVDVKGDKDVSSVVGQTLQFATPLTPSVARLPPVDTFVTPPTTISPYANTPYFVSRTLPFVRAYPHMGVPFFACPMPGSNETSTIPTPYGQFVPMVPASIGQEKFIGHVDCDPIQKNKSPNDRHCKKKLTNTEYSFESEGSEIFNDPASSEAQTSLSSPVCTVGSDQTTSVPLVPLSVPPSTFGVAGGTLSLHSYPPGLHTLPYTQMSGPQAPSAAMYYVPVFNHPYGSFIQTPSAPMVLPVNIRPGNDSAEGCPEDASKVLSPVVSRAEEVSESEATTTVTETSAPLSEVQEDTPTSTAKSTVSEAESAPDCISCPEQPLNSQGFHSLPDCIPAKGSAVSEDSCKCQSEEVDSKNPGLDASRCWADLFKKPSAEVNGLDQSLTVDQGFDSLGNLSKDVSNGKLYTVPASDNIL